MQKIFVLLLCFLSFHLEAQEKALTLKAISSDPSLYPARLQGLEWTDESSFAYNDTNGHVLNRVRAKDDQSTQFLHLDSLAAMLPDTLPALSRFPRLYWQDAGSFRFTHVGYLFYFRSGMDTLRVDARYSLGNQAMDVSGNGDVAYVQDYNLYVWPKGAKEAIQISPDGSREMQYGLPASRSEFGIRKGTFWSPDSRQLAFYKIDQSHVTDYPLIDFQAIPAVHTPIKYPMNGDSSEHVEVGVYDLTSGKTRYLSVSGPYDQYLTNITWSPGSHYIYIAVVNREQNEMQLQQYDAESGVYIKTLFTEKNEKYVEPEHGPYFLKDQPDRFIWFSERDGFQHLYLYNTNGEMLRQLTKGPFEVTEIIGTGKKDRYLYYQSTEGSPLNRQIHRLDLKTFEKIDLSSDEGFHDGILSPEGRYLLITKEAPDIPWEVTLHQTGKRLKSLPFNYHAPNPLEHYTIGTSEIVELKADDGTPLYGRLIKPSHFDPAKKYPVMVYVYGGPHVQLVRNKWLHGAQLFLHYMAEKGFLVFTVDNRGTANRGLAFEQATFRQLGTLEIEDQENGMDYLATLDFADTSKSAVFGWSYGGFMSSSLMLRKPGLFKVGVAGGPVCNWRFYEVMYGERYMDRYFENEEGFEEARLANYAGQLKGDLLVIHGMQDATVVPQHSMELMRAFVEKRKVAEFLPYPTHPHNVRGPEREHLYLSIEKFIDQHLNP